MLFAFLKHNQQKVVVAQICLKLDSKCKAIKDLTWGLYTEKPNEMDEYIYFKADVIHMGLHVHLENTVITTPTSKPV